MKIEVKITKPKPFNITRFLRGLDRAVEKQGEEIKKDFESTCETWDHKPEFTVEHVRSGDNIEYTVGTDDNVYFWLNDGTSKRYAHMRDPYNRKTVPGQLKARSGGGEVAYISKKVPSAVSPDDGQEGITPRKWDEMIMEKHERKNDFVNRVADAIEELFS